MAANNAGSAARIGGAALCESSAPDAGNVVDDLAGGLQRFAGGTLGMLAPGRYHHPKGRARHNTDRHTLHKPCFCHMNPIPIPPLRPGIIEFSSPIRAEYSNLTRLFPKASMRLLIFFYSDIIVLQITSGNGGILHAAD
jgi:hypothetical protein